MQLISDALFRCKLIVKGKTKPILIYELLARKGELPAEGKTADLYEIALKLHWERKWHEVESAIREALSLDRDDGPCARLQICVGEFRCRPPDSGWNGEYTRMTKD